MIAVTMECAEYLTRPTIMKFPFPYKLWLVVHLEFCDFLRWNRDGTVILLDLVALEIYLNSARSIFNIKNRSIFLQHLEQFQFQRLNALPEAEEDLLLQYKHEHFQRHRLDLLAKIRRHTYQVLGETQLDGKSINNGIGIGGGSSNSSNNTTTNMLSQRANERMLGDLCFMSHGAMSNIQKQRLRFQTILNFQNETRILMAKLQASDEYAAAQHAQQQHQQRRGGGGGSNFKSELMSRNAIIAPQPLAAGSENEQVIELPVELFENPHDSVLQLGDDFRPDYAGYFGNCNKEQVMHFFGDYLPMYEAGSMAVKKIVADFNAPPITAGSNNCGADLIQPAIIDNGSYGFSMQSTATTTPMADKSMPTLNLSSTLQPIFKTDEDEMADNLANDFDISMDEFITFKKNTNTNPTVNTDGINGGGGNDGGGGGSCGDNAGVHNNMQRADYELFPNTNEKHVNTSAAQKSLIPSVACDFPQMPAAVKMELADDMDSQNEANFRNFFSQYRASLNLLYERH